MMNEGLRSLYEAADTAKLRAVLTEQALDDLADAEKELAALGAEERRDMQAALDGQLSNMRRVLAREVRRKNADAELGRLAMRALRTAAAIIAISAMTCVTAYAAIPAVRTFITNMILDDLDSAHLGVYLKPGQSSYTDIPQCVDAPAEWRGKYYPGYIPDGYELYDITEYDVTYKFGYRYLHFSECDEHATLGMRLYEYELLYADVNGACAYVGVSKSDSVVIVWDYGDRSFQLEIPADVGTALDVARSVGHVT